MTQLTLARRTATLLIVGHITLFLYGLFAAAVGKFEISDIVQMVLMGTPLLALVAVAGFQYVISIMDRTDDDSENVDQTASRLILFVVIAFLFALFVVYSLAIFEGTGVSVDGVKYAVGTIESTLGAYLGIIRERLFPGINNSSDNINGASTDGE